MLPSSTKSLIANQDNAGETLIVQGSRKALFSWTEVLKFHLKSDSTRNVCVVWRLGVHSCYRGCSGSGRRGSGG